MQVATYSVAGTAVLIYFIAMLVKSSSAGILVAKHNGSATLVKQCISEYIFWKHPHVDDVVPSVDAL